jgi:hypothetical protein
MKITLAHGVVPGSCVTEPVVNSNQKQVTMTGCLGLEGFESAKESWEHHPLLSQLEI